jgi:DNA-directed RNA polymerase subunit RPC12/RpoP
MAEKAVIIKPMKTLVCEVCTFQIGFFDPETIELPLVGSMFESMDPKHEFPPPFPPTVDWEFMRCPYCRKRPFYQQDKVLTPEGIFDVAEKKFSADNSKVEKPVQKYVKKGESQKLGVYWKCTLCGKTYKTLEGYERYHKCPNLA